MSISAPPAVGRRPGRAAPALGGGRRARGGDAQGRDGTGSDTGRLGRWPLPEMALAAVTVAAVVGLARLFSGWSFLAPVLVAALGAHALAWAARRLALPPLAAALLAGGGLLLVLGWVIEPQTLTLGLPLGRTWRAVDADLSTAWQRFGEVRAPTPVTRGFVLAAALGAWATAFAADTFAFRFRARFEALAPSFTLFLFGAALGADHLRLGTTGLYLSALLAFVVASDAARRPSSSWLGGRVGAGRRAVAQGGAAMCVAAVAAALLVGPALPGAHSPALVAWRTTDRESSSSSRVTVSPLVDIRARLVDQSNRELFTVRTDSPGYWRLTALDRFDGTIWSSLGTYQPARGHLPSGVRPPSDAAARTTGASVAQQYDIRALSSIWLPAAFRPDRLDGPGGVRYDAESSSLLTDRPTSDGLRYSVESTVLHPTAGDLATTPTSLSADLARHYLSLPDGFPERVSRLAQQVVAATPSTCAPLGCSASERASGQLTPFHQARALQDFFRSSFTYDLNVAPGHDDAAIERFLFITKRGYCEQFAGTYAAMARAVGLPARVAVGFTPGSPDASGAYHVTGQQAHAWPEVYLGGFGWVAFEPTPGRSVPGGEAYTGVSSSTADPSAPAATPATTVAPTGSTPTTTAGQSTDTVPTTLAPRTGAGGLSPAWLLVLAVLAVLLYGVGVPWARRSRRARRRAAARTPSDRVLAAWVGAEEDLGLAGLARRPSETAAEFAVRAARRLRAGGPALDQLATDSSAAAFSPTGVDEPAVARAEEAAATVSSDVRMQATRSRRILWALDPRPLVTARKQ